MIGGREGHRVLKEEILEARVVIMMAGDRLSMRQACL